MQEACFPEFMKKVRMTMIPSIGYFLVVPKFGPKWLEFKQNLTQEYNNRIEIK